MRRASAAENASSILPKREGASAPSLLVRRQLHLLLAFPRPMLDQIDLRRRANAAGCHLLVSTAIAALAAALVFGLWYPGAYRHLSGGKQLFALIVSVDVILGPLLTFAIFNVAKGWPHLRRDLLVIGAIQLAGLAYGLHTIYVVRPVATVFETDRFRVVTAADVYEPELAQALPQYRSLSLSGPWVLAARRAESSEERQDVVFTAMEKGIDVGQRPRFWRPYDEGRSAALERSRPIDLLLKKYDSRAGEYRTVLAQSGVTEARARFLPVMARGDWVAVLDDKGDIVTFLPADGFF
jgi:hypothetical protein